MSDHPTLSQNDCNVLVDFSIRLGRECWSVYRRSTPGLIRLLLLPSATVRRRAEELHQLGFGARLILCPPVDIPDPTAAASLGETMWRACLDSMDGQIVLDGPASPDTPEIVLRRAREFFLEGFRAGSVAVREIRKS